MIIRRQEFGASAESAEVAEREQRACSSSDPFLDVAILPGQFEGDKCNKVRWDQVCSMYTSFSIKNFRCIEDLTIEPLARVNLIVGKNNMGKTALLEALWLHSGPNLPGLGDRLARFRGIPGQDPGRLMHDLFYDFDPNRTIVLSAKGNDEVDKGTLNIKLKKRDESLLTTVTASDSPSDPPRGSQESDVSAISDTAITLDYTDAKGKNYRSSGWWVRSEGQTVQLGTNARMTFTNEGMAGQAATMPPRPSNVFLGARQRTGPDEDVRRFGKAELEGYADHLASCLERVDSRIQRLLTIAAPPTPMIYADVGLTRPVPVGFLGDGVSRLLSLALAFHESRGGMIFIDEVENGLHYSVLEDVWKELSRLSTEFGVQIFATTHSHECMASAREAFASMGDETLCIHRLSLQDGRIAATTYSFEDLTFTLDYGAEMR